MPANNVDLSAVLPVLDKAVQPFTDALKLLDAIPQTARPSDVTRQAAFINLGGLPISAVRQLVGAVHAVQRMAGEKVP